MCRKNPLLWQRKEGQVHRDHFLYPSYYVIGKKDVQITRPGSNAASIGVRVSTCHPLASQSDTFPFINLAVPPLPTVFCAGCNPALEGERSLLVRNSFHYLFLGTILLLPSKGDLANSCRSMQASLVPDDAHCSSCRDGHPWHGTVVPSLRRLSERCCQV